jgi:ribosomal protein S18 acetylase RimI-like enzyme
VREVMPEDQREGREPSIQHLQRFLDDDANYLIVASLGSLPVGYLTAYRMPALCCDASMVYLFEIEITHEHRRKGLGRQMIYLLKAVCRESDVEDIWVGTEKDNIAAKRLYESTGGVLTSPECCEYTYWLKK